MCSLQTTACLLLPFLGSFYSMAIACPAGKYGPNCSMACGNCLRGTTCDEVTGQCELCNRNFKLPYCKLANVAAKKRCRMDSLSNSSTCNGANNGYTFSIYFPGKNCIETGDAPYSWWEVDLGLQYPVNALTLWIRAGYTEQLKGSVISIDGQHYYTLTSPPKAGSYEIDVNSGLGAVKGRVIRVSRNSTSSSNVKNALTFCEIQVWSCIKDLWGRQCENTCGKCLDECDKVTGHCQCQDFYKPPLCTEACDPGTYGKKCTEQCGHCANGEVCHRSNGHCTYCQPGWKQPLCNTECDLGTFGQNCSQTCSENCDPLGCDKETGLCTCFPGWKPPKCFEACDNGTFGLGCAWLCGKCADNLPCNKVTGSCLACKPGYQLPFCRGEWKTHDGLQ